MSESEGFPQRLKELRKKAGLSQSRFADLIGVSFMTVRRWESGEVIPRMNEIKQICEVLRVSETELLNGTQGKLTRITLTYDWKDYEEGGIKMDGEEFELILGSRGQIGIKGAGTFQTRESLEEFISKFRLQMETAFEAQVRRGVIQEA